MTIIHPGPCSLFWSNALWALSMPCQCRVGACQDIVKEPLRTQQTQDTHRNREESQVPNNHTIHERLAFVALSKWMGSLLINPYLWNLGVHVLSRSNFVDDIQAVMNSWTSIFSQNITTVHYIHVHICHRFFHKLEATQIYAIYRFGPTLDS